MDFSPKPDRSRCGGKQRRTEFCEEYNFYGSIQRSRRKHGLNYRINPAHKQWITYIMGTGVPLLNEYKLEFFAKRLPQTLLGGLKLRLGYEAPAYVYVNQLLVFTLPWLLGGLFTLLAELGTIEDKVAAYVYGGVMTAYVLLAQLISLIVQVSQGGQEAPIMKKKNLLADEDEVDFMSCCDVDTFNFVVPPKKYKLNILVHALVAGPMCGLGLWYLLPQTLNNLYDDNTGGVVVIFILGWLTLLIAQYPLTTAAPPETATYRTTDLLELSALMRSFYVYIFIMFDLLHRFHSSDFELTNQVMHVIFIFLPVFWTLGVLSPVDTFLLHVLEQGHVFLYGGSQMASDLRLVVMTVLSTGVFLGAYYINTALGTVLLSALAGYLLSTDLGGFGTQLLNAVRGRNKVSSGQAGSEGELVTRGKKGPGFMWSWGPLEVCYHLVMLGLVGVTAGLLNKNSADFSTSTWKILGYCIIGLCVLEKIVRDAQGVFVLFGLLRNCRFRVPIRAMKLNTKRCTSRVMGFLRRAIMNWVAPFLMLAYLSVTITSSDPNSVSARDTLSRSAGVWYTFGIVRAFRWIWQNPIHSLLELSIVHIIMVTEEDNTTVTDLGVPILALIVGLCRDRLYQLSNKLFFFLTLLLSSWMDKKQRRGSTIPIIIVSLVLFPLVFAVIAIATAISVPLLPLFTLPVFFFSFPRQLRSWPEEVGASANSCPDTNFYKQLAPELSKAFAAGFSNGSMGEASPGNHYLVRFQDRLVWVMVLERGATYCTINIKGLELQETSCHTVEAARIDDIFEAAFMERGCCYRLNEYPMHTLTPVESQEINAYSDARNVLTGVIDSMSSTEMTMNAFLKSLVWVLLKYVNQKKKKESSKSKDKKFDRELSFVAQCEKHELKEMGHSRSTANNNVIGEKVTHSQPKKKLEPLVPDFVRDTRSPTPPPVKKEKKKVTSSWGSLGSFADSIFSDDEGPAKKPISKPAPAPKPLLPPVRNKSPDIDIFEELEMGLPAFDVSKPKPQTQQPKFGKSFGNAIYKPQTHLAGSPDFKSPYSSQMSLPKAWRELPLDRSQVSRLLSKFPRDWYRHVLSCVDWSCADRSLEAVLKDVGGDDALLNSYAQLTMACYSIFEAQGGSYSGPSFLYKCYMGEVSINAMWDWLGENRDLQNLVKKAFRYGFKLMLDQLLLGELSSDAEWQEALEEYDADWYIGLERDPEWTQSVLDSKNYLFSLGHNNTQNTYNSRTLSLQSMEVNIGRLNPEVVRGQWANLGLELLYMTNDDEERYSIQAHPVVLRNLTVQAADPPLGYPIYSSKPISVPLI